MGGQAGANHHDQFKILIGLLPQAGQVDGLQQAKPFFEAGLAIEKGDAVFDTVMFYLEAAKSGVGEPAKANHLHARISRNP